MAFILFHFQTKKTSNSFWQGEFEYVPYTTQVLYGVKINWESELLIWSILIVPPPHTLPLWPFSSDHPDAERVTETYPRAGWTAMARGFSTSSCVMTFLEEPFSLATSMVKDRESVQYMFRAIQSMAIPSGAPMLSLTRNSATAERQKGVIIEHVLYQKTHDFIKAVTAICFHRIWYPHQAERISTNNDLTNREIFCHITFLRKDLN